MKTLRIHHLQHVAFESLGMLQDWIDAHRFHQSATHLYKQETLPNVDEFDVLIVLGGPMSVHDEQEFPWLKQEKTLIKQAIEHEKYVIGICLGAQLIANVLGARVYPNNEKEIGFFPVQKVDVSAEKQSEKILQLQALLHQQTVFHWHGETFDLPINTKHILQSAACLHQAFLLDDNVLGLQFHIEMNEAAIRTIIAHCKTELIDSNYIQSEALMLNEMEKYIANNRTILFAALDAILFSTPKL